MYVLIVPHEPHHRMQVDNRNMVLDLSTVQGTMLDPTIAKVEWSYLQEGKRQIPGGTITMRNMRKRLFFDFSALAPYIDAFEAEWARRHQDQADFQAERLAHELARPIIVVSPAEAKPIAYEGA